MTDCYNVQLYIYKNNVYYIFSDKQYYVFLCEKCINLILHDNSILLKEIVQAYSYKKINDSIHILKDKKSTEFNHQKENHSNGSYYWYQYSRTNGCNCNSVCSAGS